MPGRHRLIVAAVIVAALGVAQRSPAARAAPACANGAAIECLSVDVPLDHLGSLAGEVRIYAERIGDDARRPEALVFLSGGPGQAAIPDLPQVASGLAPALDRLDIIGFDQRGTGRSARLSCPSLDAVIDARGVAACAAALGASGRFYRTVDSVEDLDAVLDAFGVERATLYGVSYGARLAQQYAAAHPARVSGLILDSPVLPEGRDAFGRSTLVAAGRVLRALCAGGRCRGVSEDPVADLRQLVMRWRGGPAWGPYVDRRGHVARRSISAADILNVILAGDFDTGARATLPGPLRAAVGGDMAPLVRLVWDARGRFAGPSGNDQDSAAVNVATLCSETAMPWPATAPLEQRRGSATSAALALGPSALLPFDPATAGRSFLLQACAGWPSTIAAAESVRIPDVPALVLSGDQDVRTPIEDARRLAARLPHAQLVTVGRTGHSVAGTDVSGCALRAVRAFLAGRPAARRCPGHSGVAATPPPPPPRRLADLPAGSPARRLASAVALTIADTLVRGRRLVPESVQRAGGLAAGAASGGGLRGGWIRRDGARIELHAVQYITDVRVSGAIDLASPFSTFTVRGPGALHGRATIRRSNGRLTLRLRDRTVTTRIPRGLRTIRR